MMMIIITRYPASEDRLIVRPLLSRVCALRLQPAEPQPYIEGGSADSPLCWGRRLGRAFGLCERPNKLQQPRRGPAKSAECNPAPSCRPSVPAEPLSARWRRCRRSQRGVAPLRKAVQAPLRQQVRRFGGHGDRRASLICWRTSAGSILAHAVSAGCSVGARTAQPQREQFRIRQGHTQRHFPPCEARQRRAHAATPASDRVRRAPLEWVGGCQGEARRVQHLYRDEPDH
eukprot:COSAG04_NODE_2455_length_4093_cov_2.021282_1_plen_230_part_00